MFLLLQHIFLSSIIPLLIHPSQEDSDAIKFKYDSVISLFKIPVCVQHCLQDSSSESTAQITCQFSWPLTSFPPHSLLRPSLLSCILCIYDSLYCGLYLLRPILSSFCVISICPISSSANPTTVCLN